MLFAAIPILFAVQQFSEGAVWLSFSAETHVGWRAPAMGTFLAITKVVWPIWAPLSLLAAETNEQRRRALRMLTAIGAASGLYLAYCLIAYPASATIAEHHIRYDLPFPVMPALVAGVGYMIANVLAPFLSTMRQARLLGTLVAASYVIAKLFFFDYVVSIWCFFAALISLMILFMIRSGAKGIRSAPSLG